MSATFSPVSSLTPGELVAQRVITSYTLTPAQYRKAEGLHRTNIVLSLTGTVFGFLVLFALLASRFGPRVQRMAERVSPRRFVQACIFVPITLLTLALCELPLTLYGHHISLAYGLSVQSWGSWMLDWSKAELITLSAATLLLWPLYALIRRAPRHWWYFAWLCVLPVVFFVVFAAPVLLEPLFDRFEPLQQTNPELTAQLQSLARQSGLEIPASRIFLMHASDKVTTYNAYVTGFGATKRIVVWDTTARDMTSAQTLYVFGHEMGHYVLHHIYKGLAFSALLMFFGFWLTQVLTGRLLARFGSRWQIASLGDWASLPLLILLASLLSFFGEPLGNAFSRWEEHQADAYGLQLTRNFTPNSAQVAAQSFQLLGEKSSSYPDPSPFLVFWSYSHPPIADRIRFALSTAEPAASVPLPNSPAPSAP